VSTLLGDAWNVFSADYMLSFLGCVAILTGIALGFKKLFFDKGTSNQIIIAKEFVHQDDFERRHSDLAAQIKEVRSYIHNEIHAIRNDMGAIRLAGEGRDSLLHALDERSKNQAHATDQIKGQLDKLVDRWLRS
jgi:hypothetical protein